MSFCIIQDTREQTPYTFSRIIPAPLVEVATLASGDYSLKGLENQVAIERKTLVDAYGTFGRGRKRFERELERLSQMRFAVVIVESDYHTIAKRPPLRSKLDPSIVIRSMLTWPIRYGVHFCPVKNREMGEHWTYLILDRFWRDVRDGKIQLI